jgi:5'-deoxynucleotidase YfbR-like HD superfamily hydrolase
MTGNVKLTAELGFLLDLESLKDVERQNPLAGNPRRERVAEHSWYVAVAAILLRDEADEDVDLGKAALLAVAHDIVEQFVGDTFAFGADTGGQFDREHLAMRELARRSESAGVQRLVAYWHEYEDQKTPEARFVKGLDALLPILQNYHNIEHSSWRNHGVAGDKVLARLNNHGNMGETLRSIGQEMIKDAQAQHYLT